MIAESQKGIIQLPRWHHRANIGEADDGFASKANMTDKENLLNFYWIFLEFLDLSIRWI